MKFKILVTCLIFNFLLVSTAIRAEGINDIAVFRVRIAADQYYQTKNQSWQKDDLDKTVKNNDWRNDLADLIDCINRKFEEQGIKVKFEIAEILSWQIEEKIASIQESPEDLIEDLVKKISLGDCNLVIGLTAKVFSGEGINGGLYSSQKYILVKDYSLFVIQGDILIRENRHSWTLALLLHEIGHYFLGVIHSDNPESIMHKAWPSGYKEDFLKDEIELINKNMTEIKKAKVSAPK